jgi:hypothetical protein
MLSHLPQSTFIPEMDNLRLSTTRQNRTLNGAVQRSLSVAAILFGIYIPFNDFH